MRGFISLNFLLLLFSCVSCTQVKMDDSEFAPYGKEQSYKDYHRALELEESDSLSEAIRSYRLVARFDSSSKIGKISKNKLDSIRRIENDLFLKNIEGNWRWIWSGTNWGTENSPKTCNCQKYLVFNGRSIKLIEGESVIEIFNYEFVEDMNLIGSGSFILKISNKEKDFYWKLRIYNKIDNSLYLMERDKKSTTFLAFRDITESSLRNCVCGCPEKRFEKIEE